MAKSKYVVNLIETIQDEQALASAGAALLVFWEQVPTETQKDILAAIGKVGGIGLRPDESHAARFKRLIRRQQ